MCCRSYSHMSFISFIFTFWAVPGCLIILNREAHTATVEPHKTTITANAIVSLFLDTVMFKAHIPTCTAQINRSSCLILFPALAWWFCGSSFTWCNINLNIRWDDNCCIFIIVTGRVILGNTVFCKINGAYDAKICNTDKINLTLE